MMKLLCLTMAQLPFPLLCDFLMELVCSPLEMNQIRYRKAIFWITFANLPLMLCSSVATAIKSAIVLKCNYNDFIIGSYAS